MVEVTSRDEEDMITKLQSHMLQLSTDDEDEKMKTLLISPKLHAKIF